MNAGRITPLLAMGTLLSCGTAGAATTIFSSDDAEFIVRRNSGTPTVEGNLHVKKEGANNNTTDRFGLIRFDSAEFGMNVTAASFLITAGSVTGSQWQGSYTYNLFGVINGDAQDEAISQATYVPNAAGTLFQNVPAQIDLTQVTSLGTFNASADSSINFSSAALLSFIQSDTNGIVTLVLTRTGGNGNSVFLNSTDADINNRPQLVIVPEPGSLLLACLSIFALLSRRRR